MNHEKNIEQRKKALIHAASGIKNKYVIPYTEEEIANDLIDIFNKYIKENETETKKIKLLEYRQFKKNLIKAYCSSWTIKEYYKLTNEEFKAKYPSLKDYEEAQKNNEVLDY